MNTPKLYLNSLSLQNFATFKNQNITFTTGLNCIVGETGSGKSLVLDALEIVLGGRSDKKSVRKNSSFAVIEASFNCVDKNIQGYLDEIGYPISDSEEIVLKRIIYSNGTSKSFLNHQNCPLNLIAQFSKKYVDLVGQFENQKLLSEQYQLRLLDQFGNLKNELLEYQTNYKKLQNIQQQINQSNTNKVEREQRLDYLNYQIQEIEKLNPSIEDEINLLEQKNLFSNSEKRTKALSSLTSIFEGDDNKNGIISELKFSSSYILKNTEIFPSKLIDDLSKIQTDVTDFFEAIQSSLLKDSGEIDINVVIEKLDQYSKIKRKFGGSVQSVLDNHQVFLKELDQLLSADQNTTDLEIEFTRLQKHLTILARNISAKRAMSAINLSKELTKTVRSLRMTGAECSIKIVPLNHLNEHGMDSILFEAQTNPGEGFYKINEIASGGELSRILLAIRQILSNQDSVSVFLFDEIDTGLGGETAFHIGKALESVAKNSQVIAITHLPQIANFAQKLINVDKKTDAGSEEQRTISFIQEFQGEFIKPFVEKMIPLH
jgi:DNA repair protein RecN (Recombination protein N)